MPTYPSGYDPLIEIPVSGTPITENPVLPTISPISYQIKNPAINGTVLVQGFTQVFSPGPASGQFYVDGTTFPQTINFHTSAAGQGVVVTYNQAAGVVDVSLAVDLTSAEIAVLQRVLGINPQNIFPTVDKRIGAIELNINRPISGSRIQGQFLGNITGLWSAPDFVTGVPRVWFCTDAGEVWTATSLSSWVLQLKGTFALRAGSTAGASVFAAGDGGVYRSVDGGTTWNLITSAITLWKKVQAVSSAMIFGIAFPVSGATVGQNAIVESTDGGITWKTLFFAPVAPAGGPAFSVLSAIRMSSAVIGCAATSDGRIFFTTDTKTWTETLNGTAQWTQVSINDIFFFSQVNATSRFRLVENSGTIRRSDDGGVTWVAETTPATGQLLAITAQTATQWAACGASGQVVTSTNATSSTPAWTLCQDANNTYVTFRAIVWAVDIASVGTKAVIVGGDSQVFEYFNLPNPNCTFTTIFTGVSATKFALSSLFGLETFDVFISTGGDNTYTLRAVPVTGTLIKVFKSGVKEVQANISLIGQVVTVNWLQPPLSGEYIEIWYWRTVL